MALQLCPDCSGKVSSNANACIHCGCPIKIRPTETDEQNQRCAPELPDDLNPLMSKKKGYLTEFYFATSLNPEVEQVVDGKLLPIAIYESGLELFLPKRKKPTTIHFAQIVDVKIIDKEMLTEQQKSFYGRAIVGGALLGGVGALLGAFSSQSKKTKNYNFTLQVTVYLPETKEFLDYRFLSNSEKSCDNFIKYIEEYRQPKTTANEKLKKKNDYLWANDGK